MQVTRAERPAVAREPAAAARELAFDVVQRRDQLAAVASFDTSSFRQTNQSGKVTRDCPWSPEDGEADEKTMVCLHAHSPSDCVLGSPS